VKILPSYRYWHFSNMTDRSVRTIEAWASHPGSHNIPKGEIADGEISLRGVQYYFGRDGVDDDGKAVRIPMSIPELRELDIDIYAEPAKRKRKRSIPA
jgi:hypothetical protein